MQDPLGDAIKPYENATRHLLPTRTYYIIRCDGRAFHTFTRHTKRPYDPAINDAMDAAAKALAQDLQGTLLAYIQSDELSLVATDLTGPTTQPPYGANLSKLVSLTASVVTAAFNRHWQQHDPKAPDAHFDSRAFTVPDLKTVETYLAARQADCRRNAITMLANHHIGKRQVHGMSTRDRILALQTAGIRLEDIDPGFLHGRLLQRHTATETVTYTHKRTGESHTATNVARHHWKTAAAPTFQDHAADLLHHIIATRNQQ